MQVRKWGDSLAIELPDDVVETLQLKEGDEVEITTPRKGVAEVERKPTRQELIESLRQFRGMMPPDFKFNRDEANER